MKKLLYLLSVFIFVTSFTFFGISTGPLNADPLIYGIVGGLYEHEGEAWDLQVVGDYVYDLALLDHQIIIEFDGPYHGYRVQEDSEKDIYAESRGWKVKRIPVEPAKVIDRTAVSRVIEKA